MSRGLLRGHVARCADQHARLCQVAVFLDALGDAEIGNVRLASAIDQDVGGLQIAVQDAALMRVVNRAAHFGQQAHAFTRRSQEPRYFAREAVPLDELHAEEVAALMLTDLVNGNDIRVIEARRRLDLVVKAVQFARRRKLAGQDHLEGDRPIQADLAGLVDDAHAAAGDFRLQLVVAELPNDAGVRRAFRGVRRDRRIEGSAVAHGRCFSGMRVTFT